MVIGHRAPFKLAALRYNSDVIVAEEWMQDIVLDESLVGRVINDCFLVTDFLGEGGFGVTYRAIQLELNRPVCFKILKLKTLTNVEVLQRFKREARVMARLKHRNIVTCYSFGIFHDIYLYLAMELVSGPSLRSLLALEQQMNWVRAVKIACQVCNALEFAHLQGFIHRDIKPDNIMLTGDEEETAKVIDFGLVGKDCRADVELETLTSPGSIVGTVHYMAPEAFTKSTAGKSLDIYATGCLLHEMLSGKIPFEAENPIAVMQRHIAEPLPRLPKTIEPDHVRKRLEEIIWTATNVNPAERFDSAGEMGAVLEDLLASHNSGASVPVEHSAGVARNRRTVVFGASLVLAMLSLVIVFGFHKYPRGRIESSASNANNLVGERQLQKALVKLAASIPANSSDVRSPQSRAFVRALQAFILGYGSRLIRTPADVTNHLFEFCKKLGTYVDSLNLQKYQVEAKELRNLYADLLICCGWHQEALTQLKLNRICIPEFSSKSACPQELVEWLLAQADNEQSTEKLAFLMARIRAVFPQLLMSDNSRLAGRAVRAFNAYGLRTDDYTPSLWQLIGPLKVLGQSTEAELLANLAELKIKQNDYPSARQILTRLLPLSTAFSNKVRGQATRVQASLGETDGALSTLRPLIVNAEEQNDSTEWCSLMAESAEICARAHQLSRAEVLMQKLLASRQWSRYLNLWTSTEEEENLCQVAKKSYAIKKVCETYCLLSNFYCTKNDLKSARHCALKAMDLLTVKVPENDVGYLDILLWCIRACGDAHLMSESLQLSRVLTVQATKQSHDNLFIFCTKLEYADRLHHARQTKELAKVLLSLQGSAQVLDRNLPDHVHYLEQYLRLLSDAGLKAEAQTLKEHLDGGKARESQL